MRFLSILVFAFMLLSVNSDVFACEHSNDNSEITQVSSSYSFKKDSLHNIQRISHKVIQVSYCCTGVGMICCISVTNTLNLNKPIHQYSEEVIPQSDNYKSYVAYTQQRPPCSTVV